MNDIVVESQLKGKTVSTADGVVLGTVDATTETHVRVHTPSDIVEGDQLWLPRQMIESVTDDAIRLNVERPDIHDAVFALAPGQQRQYATLGLNVRLGRNRGLGHTGR